MRPKLSVGIKTWIGLSLVFWVPTVALSLVLSYVFYGAMNEEVLGNVKLNLKATKTIYEERAKIAGAVLSNIASGVEARSGFSRRDPSVVGTLVDEIARTDRSLDFIFGIDAKQAVIARKGRKNAGDVMRINGLVGEVFATGETIISTELVSKNFLEKEGVEIASLVQDIGIVQFVAVPVRQNETVVGVLAAGIMLTGNPWFGNAVYDRFGAEAALFAGDNIEAAFLHSTSSIPRSTWAVGRKIPDQIKNSLSLGRSYYGHIEVDGAEVLIAAEPLKDVKSRVIGAFSVSTPSRQVKSVVAKIILKGLAIGGIIGFVIAAIVTFMVYTDVTRPVNFLVGAMEKVKRGEMDVVLELQTGDEFEKLGEGFNGMLEGIKTREDRLEKHYTVAKLLMSTLDLKGLVEKILKIVVDVTGSQVGIIYLHEQGGEKLVPVAQYGTKNELRSLSIGEGYVGRAALDKKICIAQAPENFVDEIIDIGFAKGAPREVAYIPLVFKDKIHGVLALGSIKSYDEEERHLFEYLGNQISIALDNALMHHKIQELSITDPLTGLFNRRHMNVRVEEEWARHKRHEQSFSLLLADVDNFKSINDTFGHDKGDEVLKAVARVIKDCVRKEDMAARYGGEEFVIVLPSTDGDNAVILAERIRKSIEECKFDWLGRYVTVSIGIAVSSDVEAENFEILMQAADKAMYKAKIAGKNRVVVSGA